MKILIFYDSLGGNTERVAQAIHETVSATWGDADIIKVRKEAAGLLASLEAFRNAY